MIVHAVQVTCEHLLAGFACGLGLLLLTQAIKQCSLLLDKLARGGVARGDFNHLRRARGSLLR